MKSFNAFLNENKKESEMTPREIKMKFLNELIDRGYVKPTVNQEGFMKFIEKLLDEADN